MLVAEQVSNSLQSSEVVDSSKSGKSLASKINNSLVSLKNHHPAQVVHFSDADCSNAS